MNSKKWLSTNYFLQFAINGVFLPFWMLYLTTVKNLSVLEASSIFSMLFLARFLSAMFLSPYLVRKYNMSMSLKIITTLGLVIAVCYSFSNEKIILATITFLFGLIFFTLSPLTESLASIFLKKENIDYGYVRMFGSLSFTITGIIIGGLIGYIGNNALYYTLVLLIIFYVIFMFLPQPKLVRNLKIDNSNKNKDTTPYLWVLKDKNAALLIITIFLYQLSHTAYNNYNALYLESLNVSTKWLIGLILNISVIAEIIFFIFSNKIPKKIKPTHLLIFSGCAAVIRWLALALFQNVYVFTFMQTFHALTFGVSQIAIILILNSRFSTSKILDMQNLYNAIGFQLSTFLGMYIIGAVWDFGASYAFYISALFSLLGVFVALRIKE